MTLRPQSRPMQVVPISYRSTAWQVLLSMAIALVLIAVVMIVIGIVQ